MSKMISNICSFQPRNTFILECLKQTLETDPNRKVLVLSDRRGHLEALKELFEAAGIECGLCYGGLKQEVIKESETKQVMLGSFAYVAEGFDVKTLNTMILASPKSDVVQSTGRILRQTTAERDYEPLVIDIVDNFSVFPNQAKKRLKYYKDQNYVVEESKRFDNKPVVLLGCLFADKSESS